jgi:anti-anti-sigma regulatory factor
VDVSDVTFADLSAVALLAALAAARQIVGGRLLLAGANQALISLLATTGVLEQIDTLG